MPYRDKKTGHFVSKATWTRSKARGGVRFVRESSSVTAKGTGRRQAKSRQLAKRLPKKPPVVDHIITVKIKTRERRKGRERTREFSRDIVIPAPEGATQKQLVAIAKKYLPPDERYVLDWMKQEKRKIIVAEGPITRRRKAVLR